MTEDLEKYLEALEKRKVEIYSELNRRLNGYISDIVRSVAGDLLSIEKEIEKTQKKLKKTVQV